MILMKFDERGKTKEIWVNSYVFLDLFKSEAINTFPPPPSHQKRFARGVVKGHLVMQHRLLAFRTLRKFVLSGVIWKNFDEIIFDGGGEGHSETSCSWGLYILAPPPPTFDSL